MNLIQIRNKIEFINLPHADKLFKVITGTAPFESTPYEYHCGFVPRQSGTTTAIMNASFHNAFSFGRRVTVISHSAENALRIIQPAVDLLNKQTTSPFVEYHTKNSIRFVNGGSIRVLSTGSVSYRPHIVRGWSSDQIIIDGVRHVYNIDDVLNNLLPSVTCHKPNLHGYHFPSFITV